MTEYFIFKGKRYVEQKPTLPRAWVRPDWETDRWDFAPRPAAPDPGIFPVSKTPESWPQTDYCWFPARWQWAQCDLLALQQYGKLLDDLGKTERAIIIHVFQELTKTDRAYNNYNGTDKYICYPCGKTDRERHPKWESLITCDNEVEILDRQKSKSGKYRGESFVLLNSFLSYQNPPRFTKAMLKQDRRIHFAKVVNQGRYTTNFWFKGWKVGLPMPVLFLTAGYRWYREVELKMR